MRKQMKGTLPCELFGGPLDGRMYGDLPAVGRPLTGSALSLPLGQPAVDHPAAVYRCIGRSRTDGFWQFVYERTELPKTPIGTQIEFPAPEGSRSTPPPRDEEISE